jgi:hypothetical protein
MSEYGREFFFDIGTQYYVAARFSSFAWLAPVCGNLFHHAIEMYLKGHLSTKLSLAELKKLGHDLQAIWNHFKSDVSDAALDRFDPVIAELNKFESIRYPDQILTEGMRLSVEIEKPDSLTTSPIQTRPAPAFNLVVEEMNQLVMAIFQKASINPAFFTSRLNSEAVIYLERANTAPQAVYRISS